MAEIRLEGISKGFGMDKRRKTPDHVVAAENKGVKLVYREDDTAARNQAPAAIENLDLVIPNGKTTVLLGPSGCGKTTLLRLVAGLEDLDGGRITFDGRDATLISIKDRKIGIVFQNYALYPGFSARRNILSRFILGDSAKEDSALLKERLRETSERLGVSIEALLDRKPRALSGGERQRVAIGRCITRDPALFLLDEPLSNLDAQLREKYRGELKRLLKLYSITTIYVTHDQSEAQLLADQVALMRDGRIIQTGSYQDIYNDPVDLFTAGFLSIRPDVPALIQLSGELLDEKWTGQIAGMRPDCFEILAEKAHGTLKAKVILVRANPQSKSVIYHLEIGGYEASIVASLNALQKAGDIVYLRPSKYFVFDGETGRRLDKTSQK